MKATLGEIKSLLEQLKEAVKDCQNKLCSLSSPHHEPSKRNISYCKGKQEVSLEKAANNEPVSSTGNDPGPRGRKYQN